MYRLLIAAAFGLLFFTAGELLSAPKAESRPPAKAVSLMTAYRTNAGIEAKLEALRGLEKYRHAAVDDFLLAEYGKLDGTKQPDARLLGGFLLVWAARPGAGVLPFLVYEGLFHDDDEVVRASAAAIAQRPEEAKALMSTGNAARGKDPAEELAADLIERMSERAALLPPIEKVLAVWSGKARPGFKPGASLKRVPDERERAAALEFWKGWYEQRFKKQLKTGVAPVK